MAELTEQVEAEDVEAPANVLTALKDLVQSEGWKLLQAHVHRVWGPEGYGMEMQRAIASVPIGPDRAYELARVAEQTEATAQAINAMIHWPGQEIIRLTEKPKTKMFAARRRNW